MNGDNVAALEQVSGRIGSVGGVHGEVAANRQQSQPWFVVGPNQLHVRENARVAGMVDPKTVLQLDDIANRLTSGVNALGFSGRVRVNDARAMFGMDHRHRNTWQWLNGTAFVEADQLVRRYDAQRIHCTSHVSIDPDLSASQLR